MVWSRCHRNFVVGRWAIELDVGGLPVETPNSHRDGASEGTDDDNDEEDDSKEVFWSHSFSPFITRAMCSHISSGVGSGWAE